MTMISRRQFLVSSCVGMAALAGARFRSLAFAAPSENPAQETLIILFLRGAMDVLNLLPPIAGADRVRYEAARPNLQVPAGEALPVGALDGITFGLHPSAAALHRLFNDNVLALVPACGMHHDTRSHFEAMTYMELGTPGSSTVSTGWLTRHLSSSPALPAEIMMPALSVGSYTPTSFLGDTGLLALSEPARFNMNTGPWLWQWAQRTAMRQMYSDGDTWLHRAGLQTLDASDLIDLHVDDEYTPPAGVTYPEGEFSRHLQVIAQMLKLELGLHAVAVEIGGWDTHERQGNGSGGDFAEMVASLSDGLGAFYADLVASDDYAQRVTVVAMSEFGRRVEENGDGGTDHGHGSLMMLLGGNVNGGLHGSWPTLHPDALFEGIDLAVTTDFRRVLSEVLIQRMGNPNIDIVFPGYVGYEPLGVVAGDAPTLTRRAFLPALPG